MKTATSPNSRLKPCVRAMIALAFLTAIVLPCAASTVNLTPASIKVPYSAQLQTGFGTAPYSYQLSNGALPPGLKIASNGKLTGTPTKAGTFLFHVLASDSSQPGKQVTTGYSLTVSLPTDIYGGFLGASSPNGATGFFRVEKNNGRWNLVTPLGNNFWMLGAYASSNMFIDPNVMASKYNNNNTAWADNRGNRMLSWGFNTLGEYTSTTGLPVPTYGLNNASNVQMPFLWLLNPILTMTTSPASEVGLNEPIKSIFSGVPTNVYHGYANYMPDLFDPRLASIYQFVLNADLTLFNQSPYTSPWMIGICPDDADELWAFKGKGDNPLSPTPHPAFIIAVDMFQYGAAQNPAGVPYQDPVLHSKYAWIQFLQQEYGTIGALNTAWGSNYTDFGDQGGYSVGTGVLDEDGHNPWMGTDPYLLSNANPNLVNDLNAFLYQYAMQYTTTTVNAIRSYDQNHLIFGPGSLGKFGYGARPQVLQAFADAGYNVMELSYDTKNPPSIAGDKAAYDQTGLPEVLWYGVSANADSAWYGNQSTAPADLPTQPDRGQKYAQDINLFYNEAGSNGDYFIAGIEMWELTDGRTAEHTNWGLISNKDNAYDGQQAIIAAGVDAGGYTTGGEARNYGDFLTSVTQANLTTLSQFVTQQPTVNVAANNLTAVYKQPIPTLTYSVSGNVLPGMTGTPTLSTTAKVGSPVGTYPIIVSQGTLYSPNNYIDYQMGTLTILPATLTLTPDNHARLYGGNNPTLSYTVTGYATDENSSVLGGLPSISTPAVQTSPVGTYPINASQGTLHASNYTFVFNTGTMEVNPATLSVSARNANMNYGYTMPTFTYSMSGFKNGDTQAGAVTGTPSLTTTANATSPVGTYPITAALGSLQAQNYNFTFNNATLTINAVNLFVQANNQTMVYGSTLPSLTYTVYGFQNGDTQASATSGTPSITTSATSQSGVGTYTINAAQGTFLAPNYNLNYKPGTLTVSQAPLTVSAVNITVPYGQPIPMPTYTVAGLINNDMQVGTPALSTTAVQGSPVGTYPITVKVGTLNEPNYAVTYVAGTVTITKPVLTVTPTDASRLYGSNNPTFGYTVTGFVNGENSSVLTGTPSLTSTANAASPIGTYVINASTGSLKASNYSFVFNTGNLTVTTAPLTVTATSSTINYGQTIPSLAYSISGFKNGDTQATATSGAPVLSSPVTQASGIGTYAVSITQGTMASSNYALSFVNGTITINSVGLTVTTGNASMVYGSTIPSFTYSLSGFRNGDTQATATSGTPTLTTTATPASAIGTYPINAAQGTFSAPNYSVTYNGATLTITKAPLTVSAVNITVPYGQAIPALSYTVSGFLNRDTQIGTPVLSTTAVVGSPVGTYPITVTCGSLNEPNYTLSYVAGTVTITKPVLTVTPTSTTRLYGSANPTFAYTVTGFMNGDTSSVVSGTPSLTTTAATGSSIGTYVINANTGSLKATNYTFAFGTGTMTVNPAPLTITATTSTITYGQTVPNPTYSISGFKNGDNQATDTTGAPVLSSPVTQASGVGTYTVTITQGSFSAPNYAVTFVNGTVTINSTGLSVAASNASMTYGSAVPAFTYTVSGFKNGDTQATATSGTPSLTTTATPRCAVGSYSVNATQGSFSAPNYSVAYSGATLSITKAPLNVSAVNISVPYGQAIPALTYAVSGFLNSDTQVGTPSLSTTAVLGSPVGTYPITVTAGSLNEPNYAITYVAGTVTITKPVLTVTPTSTTRLYGSSNPTFAYTVTGFLNGDTISVVSGAPTLTTTALTGSPIGTYVVNAATGSLRATNYNFVFNTGTLTVNPAPLTVTAGSATINYGQTVPSPTYSIAGFKNGDNQSTATTGTPNLSSPVTQASGIGSYTVTVTQGTLTAANYALNFVNGTITINSVGLTVTASNASMTYGSTVPAFSYIVSGFKNGDTQATATSGVPSLTTPATPQSPVGTYAINAAQGTFSAPNYSVGYANAALNVTKAPLTVSGVSITVPYGQPIPALTYTIVGFVNGDTRVGTPALSTTAVQGSAVGTYPITVACGSLNEPNYALTYVAGTVTITQPVLTVTPVNTSRLYGTGNPAFSYTITGFVNGDTASVVTGSPNLSSPALATSPVGPFVINAALGSLKATNYTFTMSSGTLTVTQAPLTVTALTSTISYGATIPSLTYTFSGFKNGETQATATTGAPSISSAVVQSSGIGTYPVTVSQGTLAASNYALSFVNGSVTINPVVLTVRASGVTMTYGANMPALTFTLSGLKNGDTLASATTGTPSITSTGGQGSNVGTYPITAAQGTFSAPNYTLAYTNATLTVNPATLTVRASNIRIPQGQPINLVYAVTGLVNNDSLTGVPALTTTAVQGSAAGTYPITISAGTITMPNYNLNLYNGTLTIY